jgi:2-polyprenyl-3-methyl-5-hydroxy-6-metoxy-1,4-benzoquinol methylase
VQEKEQQEIDLEFVLNEFSNWAITSGQGVEARNSQSASDFLVIDPVLNTLNALRHRIWDAKQLTYIRGWTPKWLNPLIRVFRRKVMDRALCDIQHASVDALIRVLELHQETQKNTRHRENEIEESVRADLDDVFKRNLVLTDKIESLTIESKELSTRFVEAIANSEEAMTSEHSKLIALINETRENFREYMLQSTSALRREMMTHGKLFEISIEELQASGSAELSIIREETSTKSEAIEASLEELRESGVAAVSAVRKKMSSQAKAIENSIENILKHGSNSLSKKNMERVMAETYYKRMRGESSWLKERFAHRYRILQESFGKQRMAGKLRCLDLGCGRGEWLEVLSKEDHEVVGIDGDEMMTDACLQKGFEVRTGDIVESLSNIENDSFDLISLFHVMEHLDMDTICSLLVEIFRIGRPGLSLVFEIPNIHNPFISSANFYLDPTHRTKLPLELIEHLLDVFEFDFVHARFLERNPAHASLFVGGGQSGVCDERFDHMELLVVATARATS